MHVEGEGPAGGAPWPVNLPPVPEDVEEEEDAALPHSMVGKRPRESNGNFSTARIGARNLDSNLES